MPNMMRCPHCGGEIDMSEEPIFCEHCGKDILSAYTNLEETGSLNFAESVNPNPVPTPNPIPIAAESTRRSEIPPKAFGEFEKPAMAAPKEYHYVK